jgi:predicted RNase H-like HicB family nuclease
MEKHTVVVHEEPEGGFWAEVPALPGCYSQADSLSELIDNVREAISGVLAVMREQGACPETNIQVLDIAV